jgi:hypothetical protein
VTIRGGDDLDRDDRVDLGEQVDLDLVHADRADRLVHVDVVPVDPDAGLRLDRHGHVGGRDAAEQLALLAGVCRHGDRRAISALGHLLGVGLGRVDAHGVCALEALLVLDPALGRLDGEPRGIR